MTTLGVEKFVVNGEDIKPFFVQMRQMEGKANDDVKGWLATEPAIAKLQDALDEVRQQLAHAVAHDASERLETQCTALSAIAGGGKECSWRKELDKNPTFEMLATKAVSVGVSPLGSSLHEKFQALQKDLLQHIGAPSRP